MSLRTILKTSTKAVATVIARPSTTASLRKMLYRSFTHSTHATQKAIGILGLAADPIHNGHLHIAREAKKALGLNEVRLMVCHNPAHKKPKASPMHRLEMTRLAVLDEPGIKVDDTEFQRAEPSITIDTLEILRKALPKTPLVFIIGMDGLESFPQWDRSADILNISHLAVVDRPNYFLPKTGEIAALLRQRLVSNSTSLHATLGGSIMMCPIKQQLDISDTLLDLISLLNVSV